MRWLIFLGAVSLMALAGLTFPGPAASSTPYPGPPIQVVLAPLTDVDNLERVFVFNNATKSWYFFDPRPEFEKVNTFEGMLDGAIYWFKVRRDQSVTMNDKSRDLTCINEGTPQEDCGNQMVW
jgi:hypothetical protein